MTTPKQTAQRSPAWRQRFRGQFQKTRMCRFHAAGQCRFEEDCPFAHCPEDLADAPDLRKTSLCTAWKRGACPLTSEACQYAHGDEELCLTQAFVENPLSKRIRSLALKEGLLAPDAEGSGSNPQDGDHCFFEEVKEGPSPHGDTDSPKRTRQQQQQRRRNNGRDYTCRTATANLQEPDQDGSLTSSSQGSPVARAEGSWPHIFRTTPASVKDATWPATCGMLANSSPNTFYFAGPSPTFAVKDAPWSRMSQIPLIPPMFDSAPPEAVADMLRRAMPEFYED